MHKTYATFDIARSYYQLMNALRNRKLAEKNTLALYRWVLSQEQIIEQTIGKPVENLRILEIGPGQGMQRALYFGMKNQVIGIDLDVIRREYSLKNYFDMYKQNGLGRVIKTFFWNLITRPSLEGAWKKILGTQKLNYPKLLTGDICQSAPEEGAFDMVLSWSVFEHLPNPEAALRNVLKTLRPGGSFLISIHLYTSINGHHDIRAFTGGLKNLPLWAHLRPDQKHLITPSAYINEWRLSQWRDLFKKFAPGAIEILEAGDIPETYGIFLTGDLREELKDYTEEELITVNVIYVWKQFEKISENEFSSVSQNHSPFTEI